MNWERLPFVLEDAATCVQFQWRSHSDVSSQAYDIMPSEWVRSCQIHFVVRASCRRWGAARKNTFWKRSQKPRMLKRLPWLQLSIISGHNSRPTSPYGKLCSSGWPAGNCRPVPFGWKCLTCFACLVVHGLGPCIAACKRSSKAMSRKRSDLVSKIETMHRASIFSLLDVTSF